MTYTPVSKADIVAKINSLRLIDVTSGLKKELRTLILDNEAVISTVSEFDLDTDGAVLPGVRMESTHQGETSLRWSDGRSVDSNAVPYVVIPIGWPHVTLGNVGFVWSSCFHEVVPVIVADRGPKDKLGEGSLELFRQLGHERVEYGRIKNVSIVAEFTMVLFPNSGNGRCIPNQSIARTAEHRFRMLG